jgi:hypothetical protein
MRAEYEPTAEHDTAGFLLGWQQPEVSQRIDNMLSGKRTSIKVEN